MPPTDDRSMPDVAYSEVVKLIVTGFLGAVTAWGVLPNFQPTTRAVSLVSKKPTGASVAGCRQITGGEVQQVLVLHDLRPTSSEPYVLARGAQFDVQSVEWFLVAAKDANAWAAFAIEDGTPERRKFLLGASRAERVTEQTYLYGSVRTSGAVVQGQGCPLLWDFVLGNSVILPGGEVRVTGIEETAPRWSRQAAVLVALPCLFLLSAFSIWWRRRARATAKGDATTAA